MEMDGCETIIECEVKTRNTVKSIKNARRKGDKIVGIQICKNIE